MLVLSCLLCIVSVSLSLSLSFLFSFFAFFGVVRCRGSRGGGGGRVGTWLFCMFSAAGRRFCVDVGCADRAKMSARGHTHRARYVSTPWLRWPCLVPLSPPCMFTFRLCLLVVFQTFLAATPVQGADGHDAHLESHQVRQACRGEARPAVQLRPRRQRALDGERDESRSLLLPISCRMDTGRVRCLRTTRARAWRTVFHR